MVEIGTVNSVHVVIDSHISPDATPESHAVNRHHIFRLAVHLTHIESQSSVLGIGAVQLEGIVLASLLSICEGLSFLVDDSVSHHHLGILLGGILIAEVSDIESRKNLLLLVERHIGILSVLERLIDKCQQESDHNHQHSTVTDDITVGVCIQFFHCSFVLMD